MKESIFVAKEYILQAVVQYGVNMKLRYNVDSCQRMNEGVMTITEFIDEVIMELIRYSCNQNTPKDSLRSHLRQNGMGDDDSKKAAYGRIREYAQKYRDIEAKRRIEQNKDLGEAISGLLSEPMENIHDKLVGYKFNKLQFSELTQLQELRICKSYVEHRLEDTNKVNNSMFKEIMREYDGFVDSLRITNQMSDEEVVFNSLTYWVFQWKYPLELFYAIASYAEEYREIRLDKTQIGMMCGDLTVILPQGRSVSHSRFIKNRNNFIPKLLYREGSNVEVGFYSETLKEYFFLRTSIVQNFVIDSEQGILLKDWFAENVTMEDMASFLREYNLFSSFQEKEWSNKKIRTVRELIKMMTIK